MSPADKLKDEYLTEEQVSEFLGVSVRSMRTYRSEGKDHPPYIKVGRLVKYPTKEFFAWVHKRKVIRAVS